MQLWNAIGKMIGLHQTHQLKCHHSFPSMLENDVHVTQIGEREKNIEKLGCGLGTMG